MWAGLKKYSQHYIPGGRLAFVPSTMLAIMPSKASRSSLIVVGVPRAGVIEIKAAICGSKAGNFNIKLIVERTSE